MIRGTRRSRGSALIAVMMVIGMLMAVVLAISHFQAVARRTYLTEEGGLRFREPAVSGRSRRSRLTWHTLRALGPDRTLRSRGSSLSDWSRRSRISLRSRRSRRSRRSGFSRDSGAAVSAGGAGRAGLPILAGGAVFTIHPGIALVALLTLQTLWASGTSVALRADGADWALRAFGSSVAFVALRAGGSGGADWAGAGVGVGFGGGQQCGVRILSGLDFVVEGGPQARILGVQGVHCGDKLVQFGLQHRNTAFQPIGPRRRAPAAPSAGLLLGDAGAQTECCQCQRHQPDAAPSPELAPAVSRLSFAFQRLQSFTPWIHLSLRF